MKEKDSIYIVQGKTKSALINLDTYEVRAITNRQLQQLTDQTDLEVDLSDYLSPHLTPPHKEILDIRLSETAVLENLQAYIKDGATYLNVRIFCPEQETIALEKLHGLIHWINETIFHFGLLIFIPEAYDEELFYKQLSPYEVIRTKTLPSDTSAYTPLLKGSPYSIHISKNNNLYHYSRDTLSIQGNTIQFTDHTPFNIPKSEIENCKDCAFRLTCIDTRQVQQIAEKYYYTSICQHELDQ